MKILLLIRALSVGGAETQVCALARGLAGRGHQVVMATLYSDGPLAVGLANTGVRLHGLGKRGRWHLVTPLRDLVRLIRRQRPEVVYAFLPAQTTMAALLRPFTGRHALVFGVRSAVMDYAHYDWAHGCVSRLEAWLARTADLVITNSQAGTASATRRGMPRDRILEIPNLIDAGRFAPDPCGRARVRAEWGVLPDDRLIGLVGRLDPMKDHATFLEAAALAAAKSPDLRFVCVGSGSRRAAAALAARADALSLAERLIWAGERSDMPAVYSSFDVATSSSAFGEGFSNAIAEAMACGVPAVATGVGDAARLVGDTGIVVPPRDAAALARAWQKVLVDNPGRRGTLARARILEQFDRTRTLDRYECVLRQLASVRSPQLLDA